MSKETGRNVQNGVMDFEDEVVLLGQSLEGETEVDDKDSSTKDRLDIEQLDEKTFVISQESGSRSHGTMTTYGTDSSASGPLTKRTGTPLSQQSPSSSTSSSKGQQGDAKPVQSWKSIFLSLFAAICMGFLFGFLFQKSRVYDPVNIRSQFLMRKFLMLKMFMGAMAASCAAILFTYVVKREHFHHIALAFHGCSKRGLFKAVALGSFLLGSGMAIGGACPGMVTAQLGSVTPNAWVTLLGAIAGALVFGLVEPIMARYITSGYILRKYTVYDYFPKLRYWVFAVGVIAFAISFIIVCEHLVSWKSELPTGLSFSGSIFKLYAWPPQVCGVFLGLLQFPAIFIIQDTLGSSTGYTSVCSLTTHAMPSSVTSKYFASFSNFRTGLLNWWQVPYLSASILGAFVSATLSSSLNNKIPGGGRVDFELTPAAAFLGGFLMLFGSRMAGGCTSGHGISGMTLAMVNSIVAVPAMFAGGIATAFIYEAITDTYVP